MSYILLSESCRGNRIKFMEDNGELLQKPFGKQYYGTLALQTFDGSDKMRITFADAKNVYAGMAKKIFKLFNAFDNNNPIKAYKAGNADYLCHFDFNKSDLNSGKMKIKYSIQLAFPPMYILACYDFSDHTGCVYLLPDEDEAVKWAKAIGLTEVECLDFDGTVQCTGPLK